MILNIVTLTVEHIASLPFWKYQKKTHTIYSDKESIYDTISHGDV